MIIDHLYYDKRALGNCGLVCRLWLPSSRFHLFSSILLSPRNMHRAVAALCPPHSTIPPYVRCVDIYEHERGRIHESLRQLPPMSAVENLALHGFHWDNQTSPSVDTLFPFFRNVKTLRLSSVEFNTLHSAFEFLSSATSLECLRLGPVYGWGYEEINPESLTQFPLPPLKRITFERHFHMPALFDWLDLGRSVARINSVTLHLKYVATIRSVSCYLQALGPVLEHLVIVGLGSNHESIGMPIDIITACCGNINSNVDSR
jgi:hypothetical protein